MQICGVAAAGPRVYLYCSTLSPVDARFYADCRSKLRACSVSWTPLLTFSAASVCQSPANTFGKLKQLTHWRPQESVARKSLITHVHVGLCVIHSVTVTLFRCISMPAGFRRHLLEKFVTLLSLKYVFFSRLMIISTFFFN